jgi:hypothetical protein
MSQILANTECGHKNFRNCDVGIFGRGNVLSCKNCEKYYPSEGDLVEKRCRECGEDTTVIIQSRYTSQHFDGKHGYDISDLTGQCQHCEDYDNSATAELVSHFYGEDVWYVSEEEAKSLGVEKYSERKDWEKYLDKLCRDLADSPKEELVRALKAIHGGIER